MSIRLLYHSSVPPLKRTPGPYPLDSERQPHHRVHDHSHDKKTKSKNKKNKRKNPPPASTYRHFVENGLTIYCKKQKLES